MKLRWGILAGIVVMATGLGIREVKAAPQQPLTSPCVVMVPSDWGEFKGISKFGLVFEDKAGTLRVIDNMPCDIQGGYHGVPNVGVEIRRK